MKLKNIELNSTGQPVIAVAFNDDKSYLNNKQDADIVEIRIDQFSSFDSDDVCEKLSKFSQIPSIATIRRKEEDSTSKWEDNEQARLELFENILGKVKSIDAFDIELSADDIVHEVIKVVHQHQKVAIVSFHDFAKTPPLEELVAIIDDAKKIGADIVKIATKVNGDDDICTLEELTKTHKDKNLIIVGMGKKGMRTRIELPLLGSLITFASSDNYCSAPGQLSYKETKKRISERLH